MTSWLSSGDSGKTLRDQAIYHVMRAKRKHKEALEHFDKMLVHEIHGIVIENAKRGKHEMILDLSLTKSFEQLSKANEFFLLGDNTLSTIDWNDATLQLSEHLIKELIKYSWRTPSTIELRWPLPEDNPGSKR